MCSWMNSGLTETPAGRPSRMATNSGPCDSPAVNQRSMCRSSHSVRVRSGDGRPHRRNDLGLVRERGELVPGDEEPHLPHGLGDEQVES